MAVLVILWAAISRSFRLGGFLLAAALAIGLLFATALALDGSAAGFVGRYRLAIDVENATLAHQVSAFVNLDLRAALRILTPQMAAGMFFLLALGAAVGRATAGPAPDRRRGGGLKIGWPHPVMAAAALCGVALGPGFAPIVNPFQKAAIIVCVPLGILAGDLLSKSRGRPGKASMAWAALFCAPAAIFGLGSNNAAIVTVSLSSFFPLLGLSLLAVPDGPEAPRRMLGLAVSGLLVVSALMASSWARPYRQPAPLWAADRPVPMPAGGPELLLSEPQAGFFGRLYEIIREDFEPGTPVIDLTGRLPGVIYAMGGLLPKTPWLNSIIPARDSAGVFFLKRLSCEELARAWVIIAENPAPYHFDPGVLAAAGLGHQNHYQLAGEAGLPARASDGSLAHQNLLFLRPMDGWPVRAEACRAGRETFAGG